MPTPFHLAIRVHDLAAARAFYGDVLGCCEGRSARKWVDFDLYGHQLVCHVVEQMRPAAVAGENPVDGPDVPNSCSSLFASPGQPGEQATLFLLDPSGTALEFKAFADIAGQLFARSGRNAWPRVGKVHSGHPRREASWLLPHQVLKVAPTQRLHD